jgi:cyclohexyl-isocyanide hydratase
MTSHIGLLIFPGMTQLDVTAPHQVFSLLNDTRVHLLWKTLEPITSNEGMTLLPTTTFDECPTLEVICVPGGGMGAVEMMRDETVLEFLRQKSAQATYITSVCTGSLILAAAGLLQGYRAACHWLFRDQLAMLGVEVATERVVVDRDRITGGGVTAGIDFAIAIAAKLSGEATAKTIQLLLEYNPAPPFEAGTPEKAGAVLVERVTTLGKDLLEASLAQTKQTIQSSNFCL